MIASRLGCSGLLLVGLCVAAGAAHPDRGRIQPYPENPRYWQFKGKPVLLLGGSIDDNLFQIPDLKRHLDLLAGVGGNYVRNTMSSRDTGNVWPFAKKGRAYDLDRSSDEYWTRFEALLKLASERDVIVQIELWDRFDFAGYMQSWSRNPYNPSNNINYTAAASALKEEIRTHPSRRENAFFRSVPALENNRVVLRYQRAQVDKMLSISLRYGNVLYCMDNETNESPEWGAYWSHYIRKKAAEARVEVHTTEMWDHTRDLLHEHHKRTYDHPETYSFCDVSQNNSNRGQMHWDNLVKVRAYVKPPRPLNNVKIYGSDEVYLKSPPGARDGVGGRYGRTRDAVERFWRNIFGGMASSRFHRPPSGLGLGKTSQSCLRSMRMLTAETDVFACAPHNDLLSNRTPNEAYCLASPGTEFAVYFPDGGEVTLDIRSLTRPATIRWLDISSSTWKETRTLKPGRTVTLSPPGKGHWAALIGARARKGKPDAK
jgi:hypothetical protein